MNEEKNKYTHQAFILLKIVFIIAPILAGLDKFYYLLTNWEIYLSPFALQVLGGHGRLFMRVVGIVEIIAGLGVIWKPKIFAYIIGIWIALIIINLLMVGKFYDIALRDLGLCLSAFALARLSHKMR